MPLRTAAVAGLPPSKGSWSSRSCSHHGSPRDGCQEPREAWHIVSHFDISAAIWLRLRRARRPKRALTACWPSPEIAQETKHALAPFANEPDRIACRTDDHVFVSPPGSGGRGFRLRDYSPSGAAVVCSAGPRSLASRSSMSQSAGTKPWTPSASSCLLASSTSGSSASASLQSLRKFR